ncbi:MAG TPA: hypothetical protein PKI11_20870 [Candidatus Hydrogenedentes bacterium]|nr:hypothetical protein [Candidatus Hydrogenedentota bacterium]HNT88085.1 hypothetical protein [Candidatus Hydrogenedentota bacterium]
MVKPHLRAEQRLRLAIPHAGFNQKPIEERPRFAQGREPLPVCRRKIIATGTQGVFQGAPRRRLEQRLDFGLRQRTPFMPPINVFICPAQPREGVVGKPFLCDGPRREGLPICGVLIR